MELGGNEGGEKVSNPIKIYQWMDRIFDPLPKEIKQDPKDPRAMLYYKAQDESYKRHKYLCYRNLILKSLLTFVLGLLFSFLLKLK